MKKKKIIFALSCMAIITICTLNVRNSLSIANELGYSNFANLLTLNSASAEEGGGSCTGGVCDQANGHRYSTIEVNGTSTCCGAKSTTSGDKSS